MSHRALFTDGLALVLPLLTPDTLRPQLPPRMDLEEVLRKRLQLPPDLPEVRCVARARIPTTQDTEIYLHLYTNNVDTKEHLAIVFGEDIRLRTLFQRTPGETSQERMTRGAYVGQLRPGRHDADVDPELHLKAVFSETGEMLGTVDTTQEEALQVEALRQWHAHHGHQYRAPSTLVRIHSECYTGETAWLARCDCGEQFDEAGRLMGANGHGCVVYLRQEGRGIGLGEKLKAYNLQDLGADTVQANLMLRHPADGRLFGLATAILVDLGLTLVRLLTNNPDKIIAVEGPQRQVEVVERVPMVPLAWRGQDGVHLKEVDGYLRTKVEKMGHLLDVGK